MQRAIDKGIDLLAITDHDNVDSYRAISPESKLQLIHGIEFSTSWRKMGIHIVGLNINITQTELKQGIERQKQARLLRADRILVKLNKKFGFNLSLEDIKQSIGSENVGRPHIAQALIDKGYVKNCNQAFKRYLGAGKAGDIKENWASMEEVCDWITHAGGNAVIAHPLKYKMTRTRLIECIKDFKSAGGSGIEVCSGMQDTGSTDMIARLSESHELFASVGSDFHRPGNSWSELGQYSPLPKYCQPIWQQW